MRMLILALSALLSLNAAALAAPKAATVAPAGYEGVRPACWPNGAQYRTRSCCLERGAARHYSSDFSEKFCTDHGFTR